MLYGDLYEEMYQIKEGWMGEEEKRLQWIECIARNTHRVEQTLLFFSLAILRSIDLNSMESIQRRFNNVHWCDVPLMYHSWLQIHFHWWLRSHDVPISLGIPCYSSFLFLWISFWHIRVSDALDDDTSSELLCLNTTYLMKRACAKSWK